MDRNTTNYRHGHFPNDLKKPSSHDNAEHHWPKEQDCERVDSGFDSYYSYDSVSSGYSSHIEQAITTQFSSLSLTTPSATLSTQNSNEIDRHDSFNKTGITEDRLDSGLGSLSIPECSIPETKQITEPVVEESEEKDIINYYFPDQDGDTFLHLAIIQKRVDIAFNMIQMCTIPELLDIANKQQQTALHLSVITDQPQITRCLVAYGANLRCKDGQGNTPFHIACERGLAAHVEMLTVKLDPEEDPGLQKFSLPQDVNERNYLGFTPLHLAAMNDQLDIVDALINHFRCDVNVHDIKSGRTALHHAVERKNINITNLILSAGAEVDALTYDEYSPLHFAAARGLPKETVALLEKCADIYLITRDDFDVFELSEHSARVHRMLRVAEKKYKARLNSRQPITAMK